MNQWSEVMCHSERSEESRVHQASVTEILRYALDDYMTGSFYYETSTFSCEISLHLINGADTYPVPCRFGEDVAHSMTDGIDTGGSDAVLIYQDGFHRIGTTLGEVQVIFFRAFGRSIAIDGYIHIRMVLQIIGHMLDARHLRAFHIRLVETEGNHRFYNVQGITFGHRLLAIGRASCRERV